MGHAHAPSGCPEEAGLSLLKTGHREGARSKNSASAERFEEAHKDVSDGGLSLTDVLKSVQSP